ncbi:hypothetical protein [Streptomyces sp. SUK 48]|uniref:hypothetical protein n=1 Tax=Streptomyces sp. SUK 48 TaxID=2582831 RepID=UPI001FBB504F|nr:hypothetical protein [Streptomyces sp. SUK 48]
MDATVAVMRRRATCHGAATLAHAAGAELKAIQGMLDRSSITVTDDTYTSLLTEADLAIAETTARLVPRARAAYKNDAPEAQDEADAVEANVPDGAGAPGENSGLAHRPLTQTAPDKESEAE